MIFVSIASFRDPELFQTVKSCFDNADNPDEVVVGIYSQVAEGEHPDLSAFNVREVVVPYTEAQGAGYARAQVQKLFQDEEYYMQVDSHTLFEPHWDTRLIHWEDYLPTHQPLISGWAAPYSYENGQVVHRHEDGAWQWEPHTTRANSYKNTWIGARVPIDTEYAEMQVLLAGFIFVKGSWVRDVPYDPRIPFWGEEFLLSVRSYAAGYEMFAVNEILVRHNYQRHGTVRAWDDVPDWDERTKQAMKVQRDVLCLREPQPYGIKNEDIPFYFDYLVKIDKRELAWRAERIYLQSLKA